MNTTGGKISIIGAGNVGATTAFALMQAPIAGEIVLVDIDAAKAEGEAMDLAHGISFLAPVKVHAGDYKEIAGSDVVVLTAGANQKPGETRLDLVRKNKTVFAQIVPQVMRYAPEAVLLVVTNPVDILTKYVHELSGLPKARVIGSGTVLDTSRLKGLLSDRTGIDARDVHTYILGEHGDSEMVPWSLTSIAGMSFDEYCQKFGSCCAEHDKVACRQGLLDEVRQSGYQIIERKGATFYAVALAVRRIVEAIVRDEHSLLTVSTRVAGMMGFPDVCLSLPVVVGNGGAIRVLEVDLPSEEDKLLRYSAEILSKNDVNL